MGLICKLFDHKWDHCTCTRCGEVRDLGDHRWVGCVCKNCGKVRDEGHNWRGSCTCKSCGKVRDTLHRYKNGRCVVCGEPMNAAKVAEEIRRQYAAFRKASGIGAVTEWRSVDDSALDLVIEARKGLEKREADDVLLAWMLALVCDGGWNNDIIWNSWFRKNAAQLWPIRTADASIMLRLFTAIRADDASKYNMSIFWKLCEVAQTDQTDPAQAIAVCREAGLDDAQTRDFLRAIHVSDGVLVTPCEAGKHEWEDVEDDDPNSRYGSGSGEDYDWGPSSWIETQRCKICGATQKITVYRR